MPQPRLPTDQELRDEFSKMLVMFTEPDGPKKLESHIFAKGRTEMYYLLAYLFTRCALAEIRLLKYEKPPDSG